MSGVRGVPEVLHVGADQHLSQLCEVAMVLVLDLHNSPRVLASPDHLVTHLRCKVGELESEH